MTFPLPAIEAVLFTLPQEQGGYNLAAIDVIARHWTFVTQWLPWRTGIALRFNPTLHILEASWSREGSSFNVMDAIGDDLRNAGLANPQTTFMNLVQGLWNDEGGAFSGGGYTGFFYGLCMGGEAVLGPILREAGRPELDMPPPEVYWYNWRSYQRALYIFVHEIGHSAFKLGHGDEPGDAQGSLMERGYVSPGSLDSPNFLPRHLTEIAQSPYAFGSFSGGMPLPLMPGATPPKARVGDRVTLHPYLAPWAAQIIDYPSPVLLRSPQWSSEWQTWLYPFLVLTDPVLFPSPWVMWPEWYLLDPVPPGE